MLALTGDVFLLTLMGAALSSIVSAFISTQSQSSAVGTIVSSGYGFICGAYMPVSQFSKPLRDALDMNLYFFGTPVSRGAMYAVLIIAIVAFISAYVLICRLCRD